MIIPPAPPAIGAIMKREAPYLAEWVAWHRLQGFELIVADNCTDGPQTAMLRRLAAAGELTYLDARDMTDRPQLAAYEGIRAAAIAGPWPALGFLDADEFFEPLGPDPWGGAALIARQLARPLVHAIGLRWCIFGSGGQVRSAPGLVTERFVERGPSEAMQNQYVKSFARTAALAGGQPLFGPHVLPVPKLLTARDGTRVRRMNRRARPGGWRLARIRHYALKSAEEFAIKRGRGDVFYRAGEKPRDAHYWQDYDHAGIADPLPPGVIERLALETARIATLAGVASPRAAEIFRADPAQSLDRPQSIPDAAPAQERGD